MILPEPRISASIQAVGRAAVVVVALLVFFGIAYIELEPPWVRLTLAAVPGVLILSGGIFWLFSGGEQGARIEWSDGQRRLSIKNLNVFAQPFAARLVDAYSRSPLPLPAGSVSADGPASRAAVIEGDAKLPPGVEIADGPIEIPPGGGRLS